MVLYTLNELYADKMNKKKFCNPFFPKMLYKFCLNTD